MNLYNKLSIIEFCKEEDVKIYEFTFGQELSSGHVNFGMVAISKEKIMFLTPFPACIL